MLSTQQHGELFQPSVLPNPTVQHPRDHAANSERDECDDTSHLRRRIPDSVGDVDHKEREENPEQRDARTFDGFDRPNSLTKVE